jgi:hypothetical protein
MTMFDYYMVAPQGVDFVRGAIPPSAVSQFEPDAIKEAKRLAVKHNTPYEVYGLKYLGSSTLPKSEWLDSRPQAVEVKVA